MSDLSFILSSIQLTLYQSCLTTVISIAFGLIFARSIFLMQSNICLVLLTFPLILPSLTVAISLNAFFTSDLCCATSPFTRIVLCHVYTSIPLATLLILNGYNSLMSSSLPLRQNLRLPEIICLLYLELPVLKKNLIQSALFVFISAMTSFTIPFMMGISPDQSMLSIVLYHQAAIEGQILLPFLILGTQFITCFWIFKLLDRSMQKNSISTTNTTARSYPFKKYRTALLISMCGFFLWPVAYSAVDIITHWHGWTLPKTTLNALVHSVEVIIYTFLFSLCAAFAIIKIFKSQQSYLFHLSSAVMIVPSFIIALSVYLMAFKFLNLSLAPRWALVIVNGLFATAVLIKTCGPCLQAVQANTQPLIQSLRLPRYVSCIQIYMPLLKPSFQVACFLIMTYALGDVGTLLIVNCYGFDTLPNLIYTAYGRFNGLQAQALSLLLVVFITFLHLIFKMRPFQLCLK